ncbi:helicase, partial [Deinococcus cavernae]
MADDQGLTRLQQLDFAALLRVLDQNWYDLSGIFPLDRDVRTLVKELQAVRNRWAHLSTEELPSSEVYRDADTLKRFLDVIAPDSEATLQVAQLRELALEVMRPPVVVTPLPVAPETLFGVGDLVSLRSSPEVIFPVIEVDTGGQETRYKVFRDGKFAYYYESQLQGVNTAATAEQLVNAEELKAHLTGVQLLSPTMTRLLSIGAGRINFVPYQYRPVLKLIRAEQPRLLIADEVGVGKTVEAGLIIKELQARMELNSVLVICPKPLVAERKWLLEMKRFDEHFTALDGSLLRHCLEETDRDGHWPEQYAKAIVPFSLLDSDLLFGRSQGRRTRPGLLTLEPPPRFDLVIVDEAHHIRNSDTYLHQAVRFFCEHAQAVLLMTATPVQMGSEDLYTLLNVLRPDLIVDQHSFAQMAEPNRYINAAISHCRSASDGWQQQARTELENVAATEWGRLFLRESPEFQSVFDRLSEENISDRERIDLIHDLEGIYTFSSLINRTRRRDIGEFTTRKPETRAVAFTPEQSRLHDDLLRIIAEILSRTHGDQNVKFMMTTIRRQAASSLYGLIPMLEDMLNGRLNALEIMEANDGEDLPEHSSLSKIQEQVAELLNQARTLDPHDPKADEFVRVLLQKSKLPKNKSLVFSTFRHTLKYLLDKVIATGLRAAVIHGDVPDEERRKLRHRFALGAHEPDAIDVLLSSEVGCEGLDFQFCDFLVNYDLPWNPMRVEQRIGRIDRYGQTSETVAIVNFITPGTVDGDIYERCLLRIGVFQQAIGGNEEILGEITRELHHIADSFKLSQEERERRLQQLADNSIRQIREQQELESKQAELFGINLPQQRFQEELHAARSWWVSPKALENAVTTYLKNRLELPSLPLIGDKALKSLRLSAEARTSLLGDFALLPRTNEPTARNWEKWLKGSTQSLPVTFEQEVAQAVPDVTHLSVTHPLVRQAAAFLEATQPWETSLTLPHQELPPGPHPFAVYLWKKHGVKPEDELVAVALDPAIEKALLDLLPQATDAAGQAPDQNDRNILDQRHHTLWLSAQAQHAEDNRQ